MEQGGDIPSARPEANQTPGVDCGKTALAVTTLLTAAVICGCGYQVS